MHPHSSLVFSWRASDIVMSKTRHPGTDGKSEYSGQIPCVFELQPPRRGLGYMARVRAQTVSREPTSERAPEFLWSRPKNVAALFLRLRSGPRTPLFYCRSQSDIGS